MGSEDEYETVRRFHSDLDADMAKARLEAEGFDARLLKGALSTVIPTPSGGIGGSRLQVRAEQAEEALALLAAVERDANELEHSDADEWEPDRLDEADQWMRRCMGSAVLGLFICPPLTLYAVWLVLAHGSDEMSGRGSRRKWIAIAFIALSAALWGTALLRHCGA